jgi:hypothetical protein
MVGLPVTGTAEDEPLVSELMALELHPLRMSETAAAAVVMVRANCRASGAGFIERSPD